MHIRQLVAVFVTGCFLSVTFPTAANAGVIGVQQYLRAPDRQALLVNIEAVLQRNDVQDRLVALGVDPAQALTRVQTLSDSELQQMAEGLDQMPSGGDILALIGAVFVILLILEFVSVIDVFKR